MKEAECGAVYLNRHKTRREGADGDSLIYYSMLNGRASDGTALVLLQV